MPLEMVDRCFQGNLGRTKSCPSHVDECLWAYVLCVTGKADSTSWGRQGSYNNTIALKPPICPDYIITTTFLLFPFGYCFIALSVTSFDIARLQVAHLSFSPLPVLCCLCSTPSIALRSRIGRVFSQIHQCLVDKL